MRPQSIAEASIDGESEQTHAVWVGGGASLVLAKPGNQILSFALRAEKGPGGPGTTERVRPNSVRQDTSFPRIIHCEMKSVKQGKIGQL